MSARFTADQMLGRLAKWLRIFGYDTLYLNPAQDSDLLATCKRNRRILLTRDTLLLKVREVRDGQIRALLIKSDFVDQQLREVAREFKLKPRLGRLCPEDNVSLERVERSLARQFVPRFVFQTQMEFSHCPVCNRFFWQGTHWQRIREKIGETVNRKS
ncbi:MAG: Mut7-C RNAse domain-containing protein [Actinomycetota bacterium]